MKYRTPKQAQASARRGEIEAAVAGLAAFCGKGKVAACASLAEIRIAPILRTPRGPEAS